MRKGDKELFPRQHTSLSAGFSSSTKAFDDLFSALDNYNPEEQHQAEEKTISNQSEGILDPKAVLTYGRISESSTVVCGGFSTYNDLHDIDAQTNSGYIDINYRDSINPYVSTQKFGWKLAISLGHEPKDNIEKAYNLIKIILIDNRICSAKVVCPEYLSQMPQDQLGKEMRIYPYANPPGTNWAKIITDISRVLTENNIQPGLCAPGDRQIDGSLYVTYRNDAKPGTNNREGVRPEEVGYDYNPSKAPDPFASIRVNLSAQQQAGVSSNVNTLSPPPAPSAHPKLGH